MKLWTKIWNIPVPACGLICFVYWQKWSSTREELKQSKLHSAREELESGAEQITGTQSTYLRTRREHALCRHRCGVWRLEGWRTLLSSCPFAQGTTKKSMRLDYSQIEVLQGTKNGSLYVWNYGRSQWSWFCILIPLSSMSEHRAFFISSICKHPPF